MLYKWAADRNVIIRPYPNVIDHFSQQISWSSDKQLHIYVIFSQKDTFKSIFKAISHNWILSGTFMGKIMWNNFTHCLLNTDWVKMKTNHALSLSKPKASENAVQLWEDKHTKYSIYSKRIAKLQKAFYCWFCRDQIHFQGNCLQLETTIPVKTEYNKLYFIIKSTVCCLFLVFAEI